MRVYIAYILTAVLNYYPIVAFWGMSLAPVSFFGSVILFTVAAPILIYNVRLGLIIGLIGCLLIFPYMFMIGKGIFEDDIFNSGILIAILPTVLILLSTYLTVKILLAKSTVVSGIPLNTIVRLLLSLIPIVLFAIYSISTWHYWSSEIFRI